jgi:hypothetical protein
MKNLKTTEYILFIFKFVIIKYKIKQYLLVWWVALTTSQGCPDYIAPSI